ncbi:CHAP domain-containing protein [Acetobacterium wieringae]|uniref:CHAP domain-containing protein n=1 Tax=Acetobacterium wieringae TaxID=52694 RepID=UPI0020346D69|nr:GBS Bsp-like repeat-containing protein [Acetobacterium wieringae]URN85732.1 GBS Bsp-like repeat-containing protein [Acetobacterium wieringae]
MKKNSIKNTCVSLALALCLGLLPGTVMAEEAELDLTEIAQAVETTETSTALPSLFTARTTAPGADNTYFFASNPYSQGGYGLPNCTAYAFGRAYEILGTTPNLAMGNANSWWAYNQNTGYYPSGSTPKLGAVICWGGSSDGHVAIVEAINGDTVTLSESTYSGIYFQNYTYTIGAEDATSVGGFQGYIYIGDYIDAASDVTPPSLSDVLVTDYQDEGIKVTALVSDDLSGIGSVYFPVWTENNGQDDLIWHEGTVDGNVASCYIPYSDHNTELGDYNVHIYAYDNAGHYTMTGTTITKADTFTSLGKVALES